MEGWTSGRVLLRLVLAAIASVCLVLVPASGALASNNGDVWVDNVGQPPGPGHEQDPHLACDTDINLWGSDLAGSSGTYTIDGWPPSGSQEQDYPRTGTSNWSYDQGKGGSQVLDVISVQTLIRNAIRNRNVPQANQGYHFKLNFSLYPAKFKTFWVNCSAPTITTNAASGTMGQAIHDEATLSGSNSATGSITWNIYSSGDKSCSKVLGTVSEPVNGDGTYTSPAFTPNAPGSYQWVATYSGDAQNLPVSTSCNDPKEQSTVTPATPSIATHATSSTDGPIHDVAILTGGFNPAGTITWSIYAAGSCTTVLHTVSEMVSGDGTYTSPDWSPGPGSYQWVATYSGDANNSSVSTLCNDANEQSTVQPTPAPGISLVKLQRNGSAGSFTHDPITASTGDTINYQMTVINTGNTTLVLTFADPHCDAGTLSPPTVLSGTFNQATSTLSSGGVLQYTCSHMLQTGDAPQFANTALVSGQPPQGPPVSATDTVVTLINTPGMTVTKLQRDGSTGSFTTAPITAMVGDTIQYEIQVTNTGNTTLALSLSDPHCDARTIQGPTALSGTLNGNVLSPGGEAQYTCSHVLTAGDASPFTNTATVTGQPPSGPPVSGTSAVTANKQAVLPVTITKKKKPIKCPRVKVKRTKKVHGKTVIVCVAKKRPIISHAPIHPSGFTG